MKENPETGEYERKMQYSDMIDEDKSLLNLVKAYIKQNPKYIQEKEQREAKEAKMEAKQREIDKIIHKQLSNQKNTIFSSFDYCDKDFGDPH